MYVYSFRHSRQGSVGFNHFREMRSVNGIYSEAGMKIWGVQRRT